jgi:8-oxo-dGTP pyrophosphatase MutT (NUDIX family)
MADSPEEVRAAGAVVWRDGAAGTEVALVHRPKYDDWTIPKGKCEPGEHVLLTAVREVAEETGHRVALGRRLSPSFYDVEGRPKRVDYWAGRCRDPDAAFVPGHEIDDMTWLPVTEAARRLTYGRDVAVLEEFTSGPARTMPLILVRHTWPGRWIPAARPTPTGWPGCCAASAPTGWSARRPSGASPPSGRSPR